MTREQALELAKYIAFDDKPYSKSHELTSLSRALIQAEADLAIAKEALQLTIKAVNDRYLAAWPEKIVIEQALSKLNKRGGE